MIQGDANLPEPQPVTTVVPEPRRRVFRRLTRGGLIADFAWRWTQRLLFYPSPVLANVWRCWLLRRFGANVHRSVVIHPTVRIVHPWNLTVRNGGTICHNVVLDCQAPITIGVNTHISQFSHLCTATHIYDQRAMPIIGRPISIGEKCWLAADVFVGSGVSVGDSVVLGARSSVFRDVPSGVIMAGSPARKIRQIPTVGHGTDRS